MHDLSVTARDEQLIRECYRLAEDAAARGNHPFGALLASVSDWRVVVRAQNSVVTDHDVTRHAEMNAIRTALHELGAERLRRLALYTSTEPCAMCSGAAYWAQVPAIYYGCSAHRLRELAGESLLIPCQAILSHGKRPTRVVGPILEAEGAQIHRAFWSRPDSPRHACR